MQALAEVQPPRRRGELQAAADLAKLLAGKYSDEELVQALDRALPRAEAE